MCRNDITKKMISSVNWNNYEFAAVVVHTFIYKTIELQLFHSEDLKYSLLFDGLLLEEFITFSKN
jgi:hypothetical protein